MKKTISLKNLLRISFIGTSVFIVVSTMMIYSQIMSYEIKEGFGSERPHMNFQFEDYEAIARFNVIRVILFAVVVAIIISAIVSRFVAKDINNSVKLAQDMQIEEFKRPKQTRISEVNMLNQSLEELDNRLNLKNQYRKEIYDQLHHQSRTPLAILKNQLEGIQDGVIDSSDEEMDTCLAQVDNLINLIDDMKLMIDANKLDRTMNLSTYEFTEILSTVVNGLSKQFENANIRLDVLNHDKHKIIIDKYKFSQILYNLLNNAYKYSKDKGFVIISYHAEDGNLVVKIEDNGIGISEQDQRHVFDAYYRSGSVSDIKGEGIGLFLVKENLEMMNGSIELESELDKGSVFKIRIPLAK